MDARTALRIAGGIMRSTELIAAVGRTVFQRALDTQEIRRHARGLYSAGLGVTERTKALELGGTVSHLTAAWHWNLGITTRPVRWDVTVPANSQRKRIPKDVTLWYRRVPEEDRQGQYTTPLPAHRRRARVDRPDGAPDHGAGESDGVTPTVYRWFISTCDHR